MYFNNIVCCIGMFYFYSSNKIMRWKNECNSLLLLVGASTVACARCPALPEVFAQFAKSEANERSKSAAMVWGRGGESSETNLSKRRRAATFDPRPLRASERALCASERAEWPPMANESSGRTPRSASHLTSGKSNFRKWSQKKIEMRSSGRRNYFKGYSHVIITRNAKMSSMAFKLEAELMIRTTWSRLCWN